MPVGKWLPRVKLTSKGPNRADMQRKVENTSIVRAAKAKRSERIRQSREASRQGVVPKRVIKCHFYTFCTG